MVHSQAGDRPEGFLHPSICLGGPDHSTTARYRKQGADWHYPAWPNYPGTHAVCIHADALEVRFVVGSLAFGWRVAGLQAVALLCDDLPPIVARSLFYPSLSAQAIQRHIETAEDAGFIR